MPDDAATGEHVDTPVGPVAATVQLVATKLLPDPAAAAEQLATGTAEVVAVRQVVVV